MISLHFTRFFHGLHITKNCVFSSTICYLCYTLCKYWSPKHFYLCPATAGIAFQQPSYNVVEGTGTLEVCVVISGLPAGGLGCDVTVAFDLIPGLRASTYMYMC